MRRILHIFVIFLLTIFLIGCVNSKVLSAGSPLQISPFHANGNSPCGTFYSPSPYTFSYSGGTVWLSALSNGTGNIYTDDQINIQITRPDGTTTTFTKNYGNGNTIVPTAPQDVTNLFQTGNNTVKVTMTDLQGPYCNSSEYWLVATTNGGGNVPAKPEVLPRSAWHGDNSGVIVQQNANHIVIHHTATSNDPGGVGTSLRELNLAIHLDPLGTVKNLFNPINVLNTKGDYSAIRGTWPGEIFLIWIEHKFSKNYGDIAYQYLVDPEGKIYEGRWKGTLG